MKAFNLDLAGSLVETQYTDMKGTVAVDGHLYDYLLRIAGDKGVDLNKWFVLGYKFSGVPSSTGEAFVYAYLIEKRRNDESREDMAERIAAQPEVEVHRVSFYLGWDELKAYVKRFSMSFLSEMGVHINEMKVIDDGLPE